MANDYREELVRRYNELVRTIEKKKIYDGRGKYDVYICNKCADHKVITTYKDKGVTPYVIRCPYCEKGWMFHRDTLDSVEPGTHVREWVRPSLDEYMKMHPSMQDHIIEGGLILKE